MNWGLGTRSSWWMLSGTLFWDFAGGMPPVDDMTCMVLQRANRPDGLFNLKPVSGLLLPASVRPGETGAFHSRSLGLGLSRVAFHQPQRYANRA